MNFAGCTMNSQFFPSDCEQIDISIVNACFLKAIIITLCQRFVYVKNDIEIQANAKNTRAKIASYPR